MRPLGRAVLISNARFRISANSAAKSVHRFAICCVAVVLLATACRRTADAGPKRSLDTYIPNEGAVAFNIAPLQHRNGSSQWMATFESQGKTAKFRIELDPAQSSDNNIKFGKGRFIAEPGSDASILLLELKNVLEAKKPTAGTARSESLPFEFANIGDNLSQVQGGGFDVNPPGHWTAMKLFIGEGDEECEVFLNLNETIEKGEFSIKDPDYGDLLLSQLARVL